MTITQITTNDKQTISSWKYEKQYAGFNYAIEKGGWLDSYCTNDSQHCFVAKIDDEILGLFLFITQKENEFRVLINPNYLSKGYGKALTAKALELAFNELAFKEVSLIVRQNHPIAINLYKKLGFEVAGEKSEIINGESMEFYKMLKSV